MGLNDVKDHQKARNYSYRDPINSILGSYTNGFVDPKDM